MIGLETYWDTLPQGYHFEILEDTRYLADLIIKDGNKEVFECSVGTGIIPKALRDLGYKGNYLGSDYCDIFIKHAQANNPNESFIPVDLRKPIDLPTDSYDCCVVHHGLEYVYPYELALKELKRVAKKFVYLMFWVDFVEGNNIRFTEEGKWNVNYYDKDQFYQTLKDIGYEIIKDINVHNELGKSNHLLKLKV